jgi:hypothetical protein
MIHVVPAVAKNCMPIARGFFVGPRDASLTKSDTRLWAAACSATINSLRPRLLDPLSGQPERRLIGRDFTGLISCPDGGRELEAAMHWRKLPEGSNGKGLYLVVLVLGACVTLSTIVLIWHFHS